MSMSRSYGTGRWPALRPCRRRAFVALFKARPRRSRTSPHIMRGREESAIAQRITFWKKVARMGCFRKQCGALTKAAPWKSRNPIPKSKQFPNANFQNSRRVPWLFRFEVYLGLEPGFPLWRLLPKAHCRVLYPDPEEEIRERMGHDAGGQAPGR